MPNWSELSSDFQLTAPWTAKSAPMPKAANRESEALLCDVVCIHSVYLRIIAMHSYSEAPRFPVGAVHILTYAGRDKRGLNKETQNGHRHEGG